MISLLFSSNHLYLAAVLGHRQALARHLVYLIAPLQVHLWLFGNEVFLTTSRRQLIKVYPYVNREGALIFASSDASKTAVNVTSMRANLTMATHC